MKSPALRGLYDSISWSRAIGAIEENAEKS